MSKKRNNSMKIVKFGFFIASLAFWFGSILIVVYGLQANYFLVEINNSLVSSLMIIGMLVNKLKIQLNYVNLGTTLSKLNDFIVCFVPLVIAASKLCGLVVAEDGAEACNYLLVAVFGLYLVVDTCTLRMLSASPK